MKSYPSVIIVYCMFLLLAVCSMLGMDTMLSWYVYLGYVGARVYEKVTVLENTL